MKSIKIRHPGRKKETDEQLGAAFRGRFNTTIRFTKTSNEYLGQQLRRGELNHTYALGGDGIKVVAISEEQSISGLLTLFMFENGEVKVEEEEDE